MALTAKKVYAILKHQISDMEAKLSFPTRERGLKFLFMEIMM